MTEVEQPPQNGIVTEEEDSNKPRPADIEADMREMERRKRVEAIMSSRLFREELERIVDSQIREGGASGILQQLSDIVGVPAARVGSVFKSSNCVLPINDIRGVESMGYSKGEKILRCKLAATFRLLDLYGWTQGLGAQVTARLNADQELFLVNPFGLLFHEVTASSLNKADMQGYIVEQGTTNFGINSNQYVLHSVVHAARPDVRCAIYIGCNPVVAVSSLKVGLLPLTKDSAVLGEIATHAYTGSLNEPEEREKLIRSLGPISKVLLLNNHGALCCGETIEEAFYAAYHIVQACETQLKLLPVGLDNLVLIPEEGRKAIYDASRKPPEGLDHSQDEKQQDNKEQRVRPQKPKWRVGGAEFEALMRMLDNAGFRTGYIYRHPLVKSELPKPKNDVEVPPAVSSLGYLLEEEELYRQGVWKKSDLRKGGDRTRWLNSPNVYQKVEVLETGTPDPKKITKWVADGSPTHSTPVRIEHALQFVPQGTNPREFKKLQQLIKDNRRADKISAGPQSHILEGVTWDEANRIKDATVSSTGDHVVLMGAASKGIIQRGYQHNATVYKAPYAKNPFDSVTDDELNEYKRTVERKHIHGEYTDTDFSESEALSSLQTSGAQQKSSALHAPSQSETEDVSAAEPQVLRIETKQAPKPSQPEVVLSDATVDFLNVERAHAVSKKPPTGRASCDDQNISKEGLSHASNSSLIDNNSNSSSLTKTVTFENNDIINNLNDFAVTDHNNNYFLKNITNRHGISDNKEIVLLTNSSRNALKELNKDKIAVDGNSEDDDFVSLDPVLRQLYLKNSFCNILDKFRNPYVNSDLDSLTDYQNISEEDNTRTYMHTLGSHIPESISSVDLNSEVYLRWGPTKSMNDLLNVKGQFSDVDHFRTKSAPNSPSSKYLGPFRTLSHFGFNCPLYVRPNHKHIPIYPCKYKPMKRSMAFDEKFSSKLYIEASEDNFNSILKRKAFDIMYRNRKKFNQELNSFDLMNGKRMKMSPTKDIFEGCTDLVEREEHELERMSSGKVEDDEINNQNNLIKLYSNEVINDNEEVNTERIRNLRDISYERAYGIIPALGVYTLEPINEEDSDEDYVAGISENASHSKNNNLQITPTFSEKIKKFNFSNESTNPNYVCIENINTNFTLETNNEWELCKHLEFLDLNEDVDTQKCHTDNNQVCPSNNSHIEKTTISNYKSDEIAGPSNLNNVEIKSPETQAKRRLMTRSERDIRKHEFYELWEDHLSFYSNRDRSSSDDDTITDTSEDEDELKHNVKRDYVATKKPIIDDSCDEEEQNMSNELILSKIQTDSNITDPTDTRVSPARNTENYVKSIDSLHDFEGNEFGDQTSDYRNIDNCIEIVDSEKENIVDNKEDSDIIKNSNEINQNIVNIDTNITEENKANDDAKSDTEIVNADEIRLNSLEELILKKLENSELDRKEGTIFNKIETTIRSKLTPRKRDSTDASSMTSSKSKRNYLSSSTPTKESSISDMTSFYSLSLSDVNVHSDDPNKKHTTSENTQKCSDCRSQYKKQSKPPTKNVSRIHAKIYTRSSSSSRLPAEAKSQSSSSDNINLKVNIKNSPKKSNKKRDFIAENIMNVSLKQRFHRKPNVGAIFSINPFGKRIDQQSKSNVKFEVNQNKFEVNTNNNTNPDEVVYSFQTQESSTGSPRLWVTISPKKQRKRKLNRKLSPTEKISPKNNETKLSSNPEKKEKFDNTLRSSRIVNQVNQKFSDINRVTDDLNRNVDRYGDQVNNFSKKIDNLTKNFDEILVIHDDIEISRSELRQNMIKNQKENKFVFDGLAFSNSFDDH